MNYSLLSTLLRLIITHTAGLHSVNCLRRLASISCSHELSRHTYVFFSSYTSVSFNAFCTCVLSAKLLQGNREGGLAEGTTAGGGRECVGEVEERRSVSAVALLTVSHWWCVSAVVQLTVTQTPSRIQPKTTIVNASWFHCFHLLSSYIIFFFVLFIDWFIRVSLSFLIRLLIYLSIYLFIYTVHTLSSLFPMVAFPRKSKLQQSSAILSDYYQHINIHRRLECKIFSSFSRPRMIFTLDCVLSRKNLPISSL